MLLQQTNYLHACPVVLLGGETVPAAVPNISDPDACGDGLAAATVVAIAPELVDINGRVALPASVSGRASRIVDAQVTHRVDVEITGPAVC